jgi:hypothetical protein
MLNAAMDSPWWDLWLLAFIPLGYMFVREAFRNEKEDME